jgi:sulfoxide reductase heme-binding subunit YedZ
VVRRLTTPIVFVAALWPVYWLVWAALTDHLTANPISAITNHTGLWTLRLLAITLAVTPIRRLTGWHDVIRLRRMLGLFAFFYGTLHFLTYLVVDQFFAFDEILKDIAKRPYITVGFTGFVSMLPLAATSTAAMIRRLGGARWRRLHRLVYVTACAGVLHYLWLVKADRRSPLTYAAVIGTLLAARVGMAAAKRAKRRAQGTPVARTLAPDGLAPDRR